MALTVHRLRADGASDLLSLFLRGTWEARKLLALSLIGVELYLHYCPVQSGQLPSPRARRMCWTIACTQHLNRSWACFPFVPLSVIPAGVLLPGPVVARPQPPTVYMVGFSAAQSQPKGCLSKGFPVVTLAKTILIFHSSHHPSWAPQPSILRTFSLKS